MASDERAAEQDDLDLAITLLHTIASTRRADGRVFWRHFARKSLLRMKSKRAREAIKLFDDLSKRSSS